MYKKISSAALVLAMPVLLRAQANTSPYSILGIGDIESKDYGKFFGMSSAALALRNASFVNLSNPASLTSLDPHMLNIELNSRWRSSSFRYPVNDSFSSSYQDAAMRRMSLTFRPGDSWGFSFGLKPYSTVNYQLEERLSLFDGSSSDISKAVTGSGGISQAYLANGFQLGSHFSAGIMVSYLWGSLMRHTTYVYDALGISIDRKEYQELRGFRFLGGLQYAGKTGDHIMHNAGFTLSNATTLKGSYTSDYTDADTTISGPGNEDHSFRLPLQLGIGYAMVIDESLVISADYHRSFWGRIRLDYPNAYTRPAQRFALGFQYASVRRYQGQVWERLFVQAGVAYEQTYLAINNRQLTDMSASAGIGSNLTRLINVYLGVEVGRKGNVDDGQISERYTQVSAGITLKEFWYNTKKLRRYQ